MFFKRISGDADIQMLFVSFLTWFILLINSILKSEPVFLSRINLQVFQLVFYQDHLKTKEYVFVFNC